MYSLTPSPRKTSFVKDRCAWCVDENIPRQPLQFFRQRYESVTLGASSSLAAANSRITRQLEAQESTRVVTANSPPPSLSLFPFLSQSAAFSLSPPQLLGCNCVPTPPPNTGLHELARKKKEKKKKEKSTCCTYTLHARSHETRMRETAERRGSGDRG